MTYIQVKDGKFENKFQYDGGDFNCCSMNLTSLEGVPQKVKKTFQCSYNDLTNLIGSPEVGKTFICSYNKLESLIGCPKEIKRAFDCSFNQLANLENSPEKVGGYFNCSFNHLTCLKGCPKEVNGYFICIGNTKLEDISDLPISCKTIKIGKCSKIKVFPQIEDTLTFYNPTVWVRKRIKKVPFYKVVSENDNEIVVQNREVG